MRRDRWPRSLRIAWCRAPAILTAAMLPIAACAEPTAAAVSPSSPVSSASAPHLPPAAPRPTAWPRWERFKQDFLSADARVIDVGSADSRTVSEAQSYALFFALVANDRAAFDAILRWTENNLAQGDLTAHLPAWLWGRAANGNWQVLDANAASDADLWIAYSLLEAGSLWHERSYTARGARLAKRVLDEEAANLPSLGLTLLPGPAGFQPKPDEWRLNPSYAPLQVIQGIASRLPDDPRWVRLAASSVRMIEESAPLGFAPDWTLYQAGHGFVPDAQSHARGSYDAIRVYLWLGMLDPNDKNRASLLNHFAPFADYIEAHKAPAEIVDATTARAGPNSGNAGFSAAAVPFLAAREQPALADEQVARVDALSAQTPPGYYTSVLILFALGWRDGRYRFAADGTLEPAWTPSCTAAYR
jgi:endoglucanase